MIQVSDIRPSHPHNPELDKKIDVWMDVYIYLHS